MDIINMVDDEHVGDMDRRREITHNDDGFRLLRDGVKVCSVVRTRHTLIVRHHIRART